MSHEIFPGKPKWTADDMPDLSGKVAVVTGGNTGIGWETCKALLEHNAKVYLAARNVTKTEPAIEKLKQVTGKDDVHYLKLDLGDLPSCAAAVKELASKEKKVDLLFLNAGVMVPPEGETTTQGYDLQWGTNVVGHFVFTKLCLPLVRVAAITGSPDATRVVFTASNGHEFSPKEIIDFNDPNLPGYANWKKYGQSKAGNILLATYIAHHYAEDGILAFSLNPGGIKTELTRHIESRSGAFMAWLGNLLMRPTWMGAITQLYAATSPDLTKKDSGQYFIPWARKATPRPGTQDPVLADKLWDYLEKDTAGKY